MQRILCFISLYAVLILKNTNEQGYQVWTFQGPSPDFRAQPIKPTRQISAHECESVIKVEIRLGRAKAMAPSSRNYVMGILNCPMVHCAVNWPPRTHYGLATDLAGTPIALGDRSVQNTYGFPVVIALKIDQFVIIAFEARASYHWTTKASGWPAIKALIQARQSSRLR